EDLGCYCGPPYSYDYLVEALVKVRDIKSVEAIAERMPDGSNSGWMLALAAVGLWRDGRNDDAEQLADRAWQAYRDKPPRAETASQLVVRAVEAEGAILWILASGGMARKAGEIARLAEYAQDLPIAQDLRRLGKFREAYNFEDAAGSYEKPKGPDSEIYALIRAGRLEGAVSLARGFEDSPTKAKALAWVAIRYVRAVPIHRPD
ncbi:MAG TPA: hypothetical protein VFM04_00195, partial [Candidatus Methylomirabilis sp.]|nr:hypothetical protein [Candidatus Methylomirabilis sp.]